MCGVNEELNQWAMGNRAVRIPIVLRGVGIIDAMLETGTGYVIAPCETD